MKKLIEPIENAATRGARAEAKRTRKSMFPKTIVLAPPNEDQEEYLREIRIIGGPR